MRKLMLILALTIPVGLWGIAWAHIPPPWNPDFLGLVWQFATPPTIDGDLSDWAVVPDGEGYDLTTEQFTPTEAGAKMEIDLSDLNFKLLHGWSPATNMLYFAGTVYDDVHLYRVEPGTPTNYDARHPWDNWELEVDADHSGGIYWLSGETDEETRRVRNAQAQQYGIGWPAPDEYNVVYNGFSTWVVLPPYTLVGFSYDGDPEGEGTLNYEIAVTPWNDIDSDGGTGEVQELVDYHIIGLEQVMADFDDPTRAESYHYFLVLNGQSGTFQDADKFADFLLDELRVPTAVEDATWGRIKAALSR